MSFFIGWGFAQLQILKKWKWPYLLNWIEYCNEILYTHWYWQDVAHEIVKWHLGLIEVLPRFKFWKKWNLTLKPFGIFDKILQTIWYWKDLAQGIAKWRLSSVKRLRTDIFIGRGFAELQILKKWKWPYLLNCEEYCDETLHTHWYWQDVANEIVKWHLGLVEVLPRFKFWKKSETDPISWTFWYSLIKSCIPVTTDMI